MTEIKHSKSIFWYREREKKKGSVYLSPGHITVSMICHYVAVAILGAIKDTKITSINTSASNNQNAIILSFHTALKYTQVIFLVKNKILGWIFV